MTFTAGGRELEATAGTWVQVPPGTPHTFAPTGTEKVRFLNLHTPSCGYGAFLRGLHEARPTRSSPRFGRRSTKSPPRNAGEPVAPTSPSAHATEDRTARPAGLRPPSAAFHTTDSSP